MSIRKIAAATGLSPSRIHQLLSIQEAKEIPLEGQQAQQLESLVERYTSATPKVRSTYRYAMLCERDFFTQHG